MEGLDYIDKVEYFDYIKKVFKYIWEVFGYEGCEFIRDFLIYFVDKIGKNDIFGVYGSFLNLFGGVVLLD